MPTPQMEFQGGTGTLVGFGVGFVVLLAVFVPLGELTAAAPVWVWYLQEVALFLAITALTLLLVRLDDIDPGTLGLSRRHLCSAAVAFGGIYLGVNLIGVGLAILFDIDWGLDLITKTVPATFGPLPASWLLFVCLQFFVGLVEEFSIRGYLQNKCIAVLGGETRGQITAGIVVASLVFGCIHIPGVVLAGASITGVVGVVVSRALTGVFFGTFYELTRNVYFVALLHGLGNTWPLLIDWGAWSGPPLVAFFVGVGLCYAGATLAYRYVATDTTLTPTLRRTDAGKRPSLS